MFPLVVNVSPQYLQANGRSPLCTNTCLSRLELELSAFTYATHVALVIVLGVAIVVMRPDVQSELMLRSQYGFADGAEVLSVRRTAVAPVVCI